MDENQSVSALYDLRTWGRVGGQTHLLDVLQGDPVLPQLLVDEDEGVQVAHPPVEQLIRKPTGAFHHSLVKQQQPGGGPEASGSSAVWLVKR